MSNAHAVDYVRYQVRSIVTEEGLFSPPVGGKPTYAPCGPWQPVPKGDWTPKPEPWRTYSVSSFSLKGQITGCPFSVGAPARIGTATAWPVAIGNTPDGVIGVTCGVWGVPDVHSLARCWGAFALEHGGRDFQLSPSVAFYLLDLWGTPGAEVGGTLGALGRQ